MEQKKQFVSQKDEDNNIWLPPSEMQEYMGTQPYVGSIEDFGTLQQERMDQQAPSVSLGHCAYLDLTKEEDRKRMETIVETVANTTARIIYHHVRESDWTAIISWVTDQREPESAARKRKVNLVKQSNKDKSQ